MEEDKSEVIGNLSEWEVSAEDPSVITAYIGTSTSIEVPNVIEGVKITTVGGGEKPIYENDDITSVKISYGIEKIGQNAFNNKKSIQQISFPSSLVEIAEAAFAGSFNYANVNIPKSVEKIKSSAFAGSKINRLTINSPKINDGLTGSSYGYQVMSANIKELVISETVRELPEYAIYSATINELKIKEGLEKIGNYGFSNTKIKSEIILPNTLRYIGESSYNSVEGIGTIKIPDSVTYIGSYAFTYLNNFEKIILSKNLEYIGDRIFGLAGSVTELILPEGLKVLGVRITDYANSLKKVVIPGSIKVVNTDVFQGMSLEELVINEGVEKIEKRIFDNRSSTPINITIPSTVTEIDLAAFEAIENADSKLVINNTEGSIPGAPWGFKGTVEWKK